MWLKGLVSRPQTANPMVRIYLYTTVPGSGIKWTMGVNIDSSIGNATVTYSHTCYPAHVVKINGSVVYNYLPPSNDTRYIFRCLFTPVGTVIGVTSPVAVPQK